MFCKGITCGKGNPLVKGDGSLGIGAGIESMLDIESITGVAGNVEAEFWGYNGKSPDNSANEPFMKWLTQLANTSDADVPKLFSTSYGEDEAAWSLPAATRMNTEFMKAGARGISLLYAAGDEGANCEGSKFVPETPGSSPWVTSVGGTTGAKEQAAGLSSGGFSNRWAQPAWQADMVATYFKEHSAKLPPKSVGYNITGRAYPDIAAQATDFTVVANRIPNPGVAGTSCASPTASGVIALLNDALLVAGKPVLGFLNPWIYKNAAQWNDITAGSSGGGCSDGNGWPATTGWDAVTGVGTPNYKQLVTPGDSKHEVV
jgi:tripeptidyl-peptidase-1